MPANRLFITPPDQILEHPSDLPVSIMELKDGPIEGWDCYAVDFDRGSMMLGPFTASITRNKSEFPDVPSEPYIQVGKTYFYFHDGMTDKWQLGYCSRICWYQSGHTLRFIKKRQKNGS